MNEFLLENATTGQVVRYEALDLACAQMLAAEDHGGEPEDWQQIN